MLLSEALVMLEQGKYVCRDKWTLEDGYLSLMPGMQHVWKIVLQPSPNAGNYIFSFEDMKASDWKEFALPCEQVIEVV